MPSGTLSTYLKPFKAFAHLPRRISTAREPGRKEPWARCTGNWTMSGRRFLGAPLIIRRTGSRCIMKSREVSTLICPSLLMWTKTTSWKSLLFLITRQRKEDCKYRQDLGRISKSWEKKILASLNWKYWRVIWWSRRMLAIFWIRWTALMESGMNASLPSLL